MVRNDRACINCSFYNSMRRECKAIEGLRVESPVVHMCRYWVGTQEYIVNTAIEKRDSHSDYKRGHKNLATY